LGREPALECTAQGRNSAALPYLMACRSACNWVWLKPFRRAFVGEPVLGEESMGLVAVFLPEGHGHGLRLAPGDAGEAVGVVLGHEDAMAAPTALFGIGAALGHHIPNILILRGHWAGQDRCRRRQRGRWTAESPSDWKALGSAKANSLWPAKPFSGSRSKRPVRCRRCRCLGRRGRSRPTANSSSGWSGRARWPSCRCWRPYLHGVAHAGDCAVAELSLSIMPQSAMPLVQSAVGGGGGSDGVR
jgi:hypothetical protein